MGRKAFNNDVVTAAAKAIAGVSNLARGQEDGEIVFHFTSAYQKQRPFQILVTTQDVSDYPSGNIFSLCTDDSDDVPQKLSGVLVRLNESMIFLGKTVPELVEHTAAELGKALEEGSQRNPINLDEDPMSEDQSSDDIEDYPDDDIWPDDFDTQASQINQKRLSMSSETATVLNKKIRQDIRAVRDAGFYVGILHGMKADSQSSVVSISIRVKKLGLSAEAIQAWDLQKHQYVILLIRYTSGYKTCNNILQEAASYHGIEFRVGVSISRKPAVTQALAAFAPGKDSTLLDQEYGRSGQSESQKNGFHRFFISSSLNEFMNAQFTSLLKVRNSTGTGWDGAKRFFQDMQGKAASSSSVILPAIDGLGDNYNNEPSSLQNGLPAIVTSDHVQDADGDQLSLPLIAMQFFMRYLTRCTEFCLVCHNLTKDKFEALKPYVCSDPLCLYQYMSLGFGPSVEHEILTQPYVVDLLISFCYASAKIHRLRTYPTGMGLTVPSVSAVGNLEGAQYQPLPILRSKPDISGQDQSPDFHKVKYDYVRHEIICDKDKRLELSSRNWVLVRTATGGIFHHKVMEVMHPIVKLSPISIQRGTLPGLPQTPATSPPVQDGYSSLELAKAQGHDQSQVQTSMSTLTGVVTADLFIYKTNFDDLSQDNKASTIVMLLETVPAVKEMRAFLNNRQHGHSEPSLAKWNQRISPAALGLLRWIVASNRSCIVQVDKINLQPEGDDDMSIDSVRLEERISGVDGWCQFRFAQGAPDKETRFQEALSNTKEIHNARYPTLFAWHGSPLGNWHSIIRSGLDFKDTMHGRAFGHGCYFSQTHATSMGYCMSHQHGVNGSMTWLGSELKITSAMCLNEIVNAPAHYTHSTPHLVVQHVDWIQTRYLFVKTGDNYQDPYATAANKKADDDVVLTSKPRAVIDQDPKYTARGPNGMAIGIPTCAFPTSRNMPCKARDKGLIVESGGQEGAIVDEELIFSEDEDLEDVMFLFSDDDAPEPQPKGKGKSRRDEDNLIMMDSPPPPSKRNRSLKDFVPGTLDRSSIYLMVPPSYATSSATRQLQRELKTILEIQDKTPLDELGWYIDREFVENVYQWIVELHSFDPDLPLAKDMKGAGLNSVVLEIRFGKDYPISPPFVRVIRPRFMPFMNGGGGHVTAGGALCMELLTNTGWSAVSSIESVLLQVRMAISSLDPAPARLEIQGQHKQRDYGISEAIEAFIRACHNHKWEVPRDFRDFRTDGKS